MAVRTGHVAVEAAELVSAVLSVAFLIKLASAGSLYDAKENKWQKDQIASALTTAHGNDLAYGPWEGATIKLDASPEGITEALEQEYQTYYGKGSTGIVVPSVSFEIHGVISGSHKSKTGITRLTEAECALVKGKKKYEDGPTRGTLSIYFDHLNTNAARCGLTGKPKLDAASSETWITKCKASESVSDYLLGALVHVVNKLCTEKVIKPYNDDAIKRQQQEPVPGAKTRNDS